MPQQRRDTVQGRSFAVGRLGGVFWRSGESSARSYNKKPFNLLPRVYSLVCMRNSFQKLFTNLSTKPGVAQNVPFSSAIFEL